MPYKDARGIWRHDKPTGDHGKAPDRCPTCGESMDLNRMSEGDEFDDELAKDWDLDARQAENPRECEDLAQHLFYMPDYAVCEECGIEIAYGPNFYWNPGAGTYNLPRPLTSAEQARAEAEEEHKRQDAAGQIKLFDL